MESEYDYLVKIVMTGDENSGKSSILTRYTNDMFNEEYSVTIGVEFGGKLIEYFALFALQNLQGLGQVLAHIEVLALDSTGQSIIFIVKFLETTTLRHVAHLIVGTDENLSLAHGQIEGELAIGPQEVVLDALVQELCGLHLHLIQVSQFKLTHRKTSRHPQLPLDLI